MFRDARTSRRPGSCTARAPAPRPARRDPLDERRRELAALLEEIRAPAPPTAGSGGPTRIRARVAAPGDAG